MDDSASPPDCSTPQDAPPAKSSIRLPVLIFSVVTSVAIIILGSLFTVYYVNLPLPPLGSNEKGHQDSYLLEHPKETESKLLTKWMSDSKSIVTSKPRWIAAIVIGFVILSAAITAVVVMLTVFAEPPLDAADPEAPSPLVVDPPDQSKPNTATTPVQNKPNTTTPVQDESTTVDAEPETFTLNIWSKGALALAGLGIVVLIIFSAYKNLKAKRRGLEKEEDEHGSLPKDLIDLKKENYTFQYNSTTKEVTFSVLEPLGEDKLMVEVNGQNLGEVDRSNHFKISFKLDQLNNDRLITIIIRHPDESEWTPIRVKSHISLLESKPGVPFRASTVGFLRDKSGGFMGKFIKSFT